MSSKPSSAAEPVSAVPPDAGFTDAGFADAIGAGADPHPAVAADPSAIVTTGAPALDAPILDANGYDPADYDWVPVLRKPRVDGWTPQRQRAFIGALADGGSVRAAADEVAMTMSSAYKLRRSADGAAFAAAWDAAIQQAAHVLVDEAFERALNGSSEPVFDRDGARVGIRHRRSDGLMMFLLRKHFPDRYGDLTRDRTEPAAARAVPLVAETMPALGPVEPPDPFALMSPGDADCAVECAELLDGRLAHYNVQDGSEKKRAPQPVDPEFEARLEEAKRGAAAPRWSDIDETQAKADAYMKMLDGHERRKKAKRR